MLGRWFKILPFGVPCALVVVLAGFGDAQQPVPLFAPGQQPPDQQPQPLPPPDQQPQPGQPAQPAQGDGSQVLTTGPVHEAFAATSEAPAPSPVVAKQPPDPIEELPPDQKPDGDNVQWLPGYWHWDEESNQYIWISGFWRQVPPGRVWVPGSWRQVTGGWQWVSGFWQDVSANPQPDQQQAQPELQYLPEPPQSLEVGPSIPAPSTTSIYAPGAWIWQGKYVWRPGMWIDYRPNWIWVPARYYWTPAGFVFVEGYWDYPLVTRGVLFSPMAFDQAVYTQPGFSYTPSYVISEPAMIGALFVRPGRPCYYFGNYFADQYANLGFRPWCGHYGRNGFTLGYGVGRNWGYDPLWNYYSVAYRNTPEWHRGVSDVYHGRYSGQLERPPMTLVQQNRTISTITNTTVNNVTNNIVVKNGRPMVNNTDVSGIAMVAPLKVAPQLQQVKFQALNEATRRNEMAVAKQIREVAVQRTRQEMRLAAQPAGRAAPGQPPAQPRSIKLDVPKAVVAPAHIRNERLTPPPNPHHANAGGARVEPPHGSTIQPEPRPPVRPNPNAQPTPKVEPKRNPEPGPKIEPKIEPKNPGPRVNPRPEPQPPHPTAPNNQVPQHQRPPTVVHPTAPPAQKLQSPTPPPARPQPMQHEPPHVPTPTRPMQPQPPKAQPPAPQPQPRPAAPAQPPHVPTPQPQPHPATPQPQPPKAQPPAPTPQPRPAAPAQPPHPPAPQPHPQPRPAAPQPPHAPAPQPQPHPAAPAQPPHPAAPPHHEVAHPTPHH